MNKELEEELQELKYFITTELELLKDFEIASEISEISILKARWSLVLRKVEKIERYIKESN